MTDTLFTLIINGATFFCAPETFIDKQIQKNIECEIWRVQYETCEQRLVLREEAITERDTALSIERHNRDTWQNIAGLYQQASEARLTELKQLRKAYRRERIKGVIVPIAVGLGAGAVGYVGGRYLK